MQEMNQNDIFLFGKFENLPHLVMKQYFAVSFKCPKKSLKKKNQVNSRHYLQ